MMLTLVLALLVALSGLITVEYFFHGTAVRRIRLVGRDPEPLAISDPQFASTFALLTNTTLSEENRVELLANGDETFPRLFEDLRRARDLITFQVFWFRPGRLADELGEILAERARAGVRVLLLRDYFGSRPLSDAYVRSLEEAGVEIGMYRPLHWKTLYNVQQRTHVRAVVVDGVIGYTGGFGISDNWTGDGRHPEQWRDTNVRVEGTVVDQIQAAFASSWLDATGELLVGDKVFSVQREATPNVGRSGLLYAKPGLGSTNAERYLALTITSARERLWITNAYFVPDDPFCRLLSDAAQRGVDVRILTPGRNTDRKSAYYAGRAKYEGLLRGGVKLFEYAPTMVHAKTIVADGVWSCIGSVNFDNRSMSLNDEAQFVVHDAALGTRMEEMFLEDLRFARPVELQKLVDRPWTSRLLENASRLVAPVL